ncbi:STAS domain-containing protein [Catenulispora sp. GP43]|uniref:STAS domain-containing protein n=1 Tax=Catenulispora sp. GP43 TaxID=3156263 RepID=UPI0035159178
MTWPVTGAMVLSLGGELDLATMPRLIERVRSLVEQGHVHIVLDLGHLEFCDCTGLRALLRAREIAAEAGGWARLSRVGAMTRHIIALTGLRDALVCYDSAAIAVAGS